MEREKILKDAKLFEDTETLNDLFNENEWILLEKFYTNPYNFDKQESLDLIELLFKIDHKDFRDFTVLSILKYDLIEIGAPTVENEDLFKSLEECDEFELCVTENFIITLKWFKMTKPDEFRYLKQTYFNLALKHNRIEIIEMFEIDKIENVKDAFIKACLSGNLDLVKKIEESNLILTSYKDKACEMISQYPNLEHILRYIFESSYIPEKNYLECLYPHINIDLFKLIFSKIEYNKIQVFNGCCIIDRLDLAQYAYQFINISDPDYIPIIERANKKSPRILEWFYSLIENDQKRQFFKETLRHSINIHGLFHPEVYIFAKKIGLEFTDLRRTFEHACKNKNYQLVIFLKDKMTDFEKDNYFTISLNVYQNDEVLKTLYKPRKNLNDNIIISAILRNNFEFVKFLYEIGQIKKTSLNIVKAACKIQSSEILRLILKFDENITPEKKRIILRGAIKFRDSTFFYIFIKRYELKPITDDVRQKLIHFSIESNFFQGVYFFTEKGKIRIRNAQQWFEKSLKYSNLRIPKFIFRNENVQIPKSNNIKIKNYKIAVWVAENGGHIEEPNIGRSLFYGDVTQMFKFKNLGIFTDEYANNIIDAISRKICVDFLMEFFEIETENLQRCLDYNMRMRNIEISCYLKEQIIKRQT